MDVAGSRAHGFPVHHLGDAHVDWHFRRIFESDAHTSML